MKNLLLIILANVLTTVASIRVIPQQSPLPHIDYERIVQNFSLNIPNGPCPAGFRRVGDATCIDVDECLSTPCDDDKFCVNKLFGYECICKGGRKENEIQKCIEFVNAEKVVQENTSILSDLLEWDVNAERANSDSGDFELQEKHKSVQLDEPVPSTRATVPHVSLLTTKRKEPTTSRTPTTNPTSRSTTTKARTTTTPFRTTTKKLTVEEIMNTSGVFGLSLQTTHGSKVMRTEGPQSTISPLRMTENFNATSTTPTVQIIHEKKHGRRKRGSIHPDLSNLNIFCRRGLYVKDDCVAYDSDARSIYLAVHDPTTWCNTGIKKAEKGECVDVDECVELKQPCTDNETCVNMNGFYKCICKDKHFINEQGVCTAEEI